ncbi:hypothetical protein L7F22_024752 [Adiantum nelumboides]|nr:hypothetical protein [Adiantum nelumboides]
MSLARRFPLLHRLQQFSYSSSQSLSTDALLLDSESPISKEEEADTAVATPADSPVKWVLLPPVPRVKELARVLGQSELTAIKWVTRCCPEISHTTIEKLFRTRQVRVGPLETKEVEETSGAKFKRVTRKDILPEGSIVYLKRFALQQIVDKVEAVNVDDGERKPTSLTRMYNPTQDDIEWARELVLHLDEHIIAINKPPRLSVQGGSGVERSLNDLLGPAYSFDYDDPPKLYASDSVTVVSEQDFLTFLLERTFLQATVIMNTMQPLTLEEMQARFAEFQSLFMKPAYSL